MDNAYNHLDGQTDRQTDISFCLPVYNVKDFLEDCLLSIQGQDLEKHNIAYEILCLDDGSSDGSYEFLLENAKTVPQLKVFKNPENKGVSYTRNSLTQMARGKYIWYVDPDDMLYGDATIFLMDIAKETNADIVLANYLKIEENERYKEIKVEHKDLIDYRYCETENWDWLPDKNGESRMFSLCRGIFRKSFLDENELRLNPAILLMEDALFFYELKKKRPYIIKAEFCCYQVRERRGSAMRKGRIDIEEQKKRYNSMLSLALIYKTYAYEENEVEIEAEKKFYEIGAQVVRMLVRIDDEKFIKEELKNLKRQGIYPESLKRIKLISLKEKTINFLLKIEPFFWLYHWIYINYDKNRKE